MNPQFDKIAKIYDRLPILDRDQMIASKTKSNSLKNRVIDLIVAADDKYLFDDKTDPDEVLKVINTLKRKRKKSEEDMVGILVLTTFHHSLEMMKALSFLDDDFEIEEEKPSFADYTFDKRVLVEKKKKNAQSFDYEMIYVGLSENMELHIIRQFIDYTWDAGLAVYSYELKQSKFKKKRCLIISFDSRKYFKLPGEDKSISNEGHWDDNLGSDFIQNNIYSRLSDKEQFYGSIWSCFDENELPEAYFMANSKKYKVVWGKRAYLSLLTKN